MPKKYTEKSPKKISSRKDSTSQDAGLAENLTLSQETTSSSSSRYFPTAEIAHLKKRNAENPTTSWFLTGAIRKYRPLIQERRELKREIFFQLVKLVEIGRGGARALTGSRFEETMGCLGIFMVNVDASEQHKNILNTAKGFTSQPRHLINTLNKRESLFGFLNHHAARDLESENFCLQSMISDLEKWLTAAFIQQSKIFTSEELNDLQSRLKNASNIDEAEYAKNPSLREPETTEEVIQYLYYSAGLFSSENEWDEYAKNMFIADYPAISALTYSRAKTVYKRKKAAGDYTT